MYPALPFGPITLPTGPVFALLAVYFGIDTAARFGRRFGLDSDDVWNTGLLGVLAGVIVARLWNVIQFWYVYAPDPMLIVSLRPSGFSFWPGVIAAIGAAYLYMLRRALAPSAVAAAFGAGILTGSAFLSIGDFLTGGLIGLPSNAPWALPYFGEMLHPVALYRAVGFGIAAVVVIATPDRRRPGRSALLAGLGYGLVNLIIGGFVANGDLTGTVRTIQLFGLGLALVCAALLAWSDVKARHAPPPRVAAPKVAPVADVATPPEEDGTVVES